MAIDGTPTYQDPTVGGPAAGYQDAPDEELAQEDEGDETLKGIELLRSFMPDEEGTVPNIADLIDDSQISQVGGHVKRDFEMDLASRAEWETRLDTALGMALQLVEPKNYPWAGAANVKYPLVTTAAIQFAARAYPAIVPARNVVKCQIVGEDKDGKKKARSKRISEHMSYQLLDEMEEWEADTDRLLHALPIIGSYFRKTWFDGHKGRNVSKLISPKNFVVHYDTETLETASRKTEIFTLQPNQFIERVRTGTFRDVSVGLPPNTTDEQAPHEFLEQHRWEDLDEDGYAEPYIVTVHRNTSQVVRMVANYDAKSVTLNAEGEVAKIRPATEYYTKYGFIPAPDGSFYDLGFGTLVGPLNEAINTAINQMLDSGHLQNTGGGFIGGGLRMKAGSVRLGPGEYKRVKMTGGTVRENVVKIDHSGPSVVLFQLLGTLIESAKDITAVKDIMVGESPGKNASPTTTLALIEQGMKVFSAIYKRIHRSLKNELKKLYALNSQFLEQDAYYTVLDDQRAIARQDYEQGSLDVKPVSDPSMVTDMQRLGRAEFLSGFIGNPAFDSVAIIKRMLDAANIEDQEELMSKQPPGPPPELEMKKRELKITEEKLRIEGELAQSQIDERSAKVAQLQADVILKLAKAEAEEAGPQLNFYKQELTMLLERLKLTQKELSERRVNGGTVGGSVPSMAAPPSNGAGAPVLPGLPPGLAGDMG